MTQSTQVTKENSWRMNAHAARLDIPGLTGVVELSAPHAGLSALSVFGREVAGSILGVQFSVADPAEASAPLTEAYQRGSDLVAAYEQNEQHPFRATVYWRVQNPEVARRLAAVDLIVSVQTNLLDTTPQLRSHSQIAAEDVVGIVHSEGNGWNSLDAASTRASDDAKDFGCVLMPLVGVDASYCEMIHPSDWRGLQMRRIGGRIELAWPLVGHFMEKGVVRRLRVRGIFLPGPADEALVRDLYAEFAASPPPLTT